jgi:phosphoesterase RecJ-like protein
VEVAFLATERAEGVKFSLRSKAPYDVAKLCKQFGGGGHSLAAGCTMMCSIDEAAQVMLDAIAQSREK